MGEAITWGMFDTVDRVWMGTQTGPATFVEEDIARIAAQMVDVRLRQKQGRTKARELPEELRRLLRYRDEKPALMSGEEALRGLEEGRFL
jgi:hypothetical protein